MPKSSIAIFTPFWCNDSSSAFARSEPIPSCMSAVSVISSPRHSAGSSASWSAAFTTEQIPAPLSCRPERLTHVTNRSGRTPSRRQRAVCRHASRKTNSPSGRINPVASATGMNRSGGTSPRRAEFQRRSASTPTMFPVARSTSGW